VGDGARVEVNYVLKRDDPSQAPQDLAPLRLEWPGWLVVPGGKLVSQRTIPPVRVGNGLADTCPGDVIGQPSQGCLQRVYQSSDQLKDLYEYFDGLLGGRGFATRGIPTQPNDYMDLGKFIRPPFASLTMREYPVPQEETYYRQLNVFLRQPQTPTTKVEISFLVRNPPGMETATSGRGNVTGTWAFTHVSGRFSGLIALEQSGTSVAGTWRTEVGKSEPDTPLTGHIEGDVLYLTRMIGNLRQDYVLVKSPDGNRLDGYGEGWGIQHGNLNLSRAVEVRSTRVAR
jgi:hypothetical protein